MKYTILVNAGTTESNAGLHAYRFAQAVLQAGHEIMRIFFFHEGVYQAFNDALPPDDELNLPHLWSELAKDYPIDLAVCISAAQRRVLLSEAEKKRLQKQDQGLAEGFRIAGLGQLLEAMILADRFVEFG
jgi:tRNA 2-thiouridine synthesizing protein D